MTEADSKDILNKEEKEKPLIELGSSLMKLWKEVIESSENRIKQLENDLIITQAVLETAKKKYDLEKEIYGETELKNLSYV